MTKSEVAFRFSVERLFESSERVYFWTVTFVTVWDHWESALKWRDFLKALQRKTGGGWGGLRVTELHEQHGVHYHFLCSKRLPVDVVRRVGRNFGIGRIHVERAYDAKGAADYLAKYLSKRWYEGARTESGNAARRWAKFGDIEHTRVRDVVVHTPQWDYRRERGLHYTDWMSELRLRRIWDKCEYPCEFDGAWLLAKQGDRDGLAFAACSSRMQPCATRSGLANPPLLRPAFIVEPF